MSCILLTLESETSSRHNCCDDDDVTCVFADGRVANGRACGQDCDQRRFGAGGAAPGAGAGQVAAHASLDLSVGCAKRLAPSLSLPLSLSPLFLCAVTTCTSAFARLVRLAVDPSSTRRSLIAQHLRASRKPRPWRSLSTPHSLPDWSRHATRAAGWCSWRVIVCAPSRTRTPLPRRRQVRDGH